MSIIINNICTSIRFTDCN